MANTKFVLSAVTLLLCISIQVFGASSPAFPKSLIKEMAKREMRYHHYLWHNIRERWNKLSKDAQDQIRALGWAPPRPGRAYDANGVSSAIPENNSGEDFLYMHRQMIATANQFLAKNKEPYGKITGWKTIPAPGDKEYPVPAPYNITGNPSLTNYTNTRKTAEYYEKSIKPMEQALKDPVTLRNMTLGQLGSRIEVTIHSWMHLRFSNVSSLGYRASSSKIMPNFKKQWDDPKYDWLGDSYASHVNPIFWKLHGWVDDRIEDWRKANNLTSIKWKGTWTGGPMSSFSSVLKKEGATKTSLRAPEGMEGMHHGNGSEGDLDIAEKIAKIFLDEVSEVSFGEEVKIDLDFLSYPKPDTDTKPKTKTNLKRNHNRRSLCRSRLNRRN